MAMYHVCLSDGTLFTDVSDTTMLQMMEKLDVDNMASADTGALLYLKPKKPVGKVSAKPMLFNPKTEECVGGYYLAIKQRGHAADYPLCYCGTYELLLNNVWKGLVEAHDTQSKVMWDEELLAWAKFCTADGHVFKELKF